MFATNQRKFNDSVQFNGDLPECKWSECTACILRRSVRHWRHWLRHRRRLSRQWDPEIFPNFLLKTSPLFVLLLSRIKLYLKTGRNSESSGVEMSKENGKQECWLFSFKIQIRCALIFQFNVLGTLAKQKMEQKHIWDEIFCKLTKGQFNKTIFEMKSLANRSTVLLKIVVANVLIERK